VLDHLLFKMACCPPGSHEPVQHQTYKAKGTEFTTDGLLAYHVGSGEKGIIVCYEPFGFNGGRFRQICDDLADCGFNVFMPGFFGNDTIDPDKPFDMSKMQGLFTVSTWSKIQGDVDKAMKYLKTKGATKFGILGFCWGNWVVFHACGSGQFSAGVSAHPSTVFCL